MLQEELASHRGSTLEGNCAAGVRICDELLEKVADDGLAFTERALFGAFDRYLVDSLPWTHSILERLDEKRKAAATCFG